MDPMGDADGDCYWVGLEANVSLFSQESKYAPLHETRSLHLKHWNWFRWVSFWVSASLLVLGGVSLTTYIPDGCNDASGWPFQWQPDLQALPEVIERGL